MSGYKFKRECFLKTYVILSELWILNRSSTTHTYLHYMLYRKYEIVSGVLATPSFGCIRRAPLHVTYRYVSIRDSIRSAGAAMILFLGKLAVPHVYYTAMTFTYAIPTHRYLQKKKKKYGIKLFVSFASGGSRSIFKSLNTSLSYNK